MLFGQFSYLATVIIFAFGAVLIEWSLGFRTLKRYWKLIGIIVIIGLIGTAIAERIALKSESWVYNPQKMFNTFIFGAAFETYIFAIFVAIAIASATLVWSEYEEKNRPLIKTTFRKIKHSVILKR